MGKKWTSYDTMAVTDILDSEPMGMVSDSGIQKIWTRGGLRQYLDDRYLSLDAKWREPVRVSPVIAIDLNSPGSIIDNAALNNLDRVLIRSQTNFADNGIYVFNGATSPMTRAEDANTAAKLNGIYVPVLSGTLAGAIHRQSSTISNLGTDAVTFPIVWLERSKLKYQTNIGDGTSTTYTVTHNLQSNNVLIQVSEVSSGLVVTPASITILSLNQVQIVFSSPIGNGTHRVAIIN